MDKVIESVEKLKLSNRINEHLAETNANYLSFLRKLLFLDEKVLKLYLKTVKTREIINNQETELEQSFLIELYLNSQRTNSIDIATKMFEDGLITKEEIKKLHRVVIKNSADDDPKNYNFRSDNDKWVGCFGTGGRQVVDYYPPDFKEIDCFMEYILNYLNDEKTDSELNQTLIKPFIVHGLLAYLQAFGNGNTRLARVLQHAKIWHMTNTKEGIFLPTPAIYLSKNYLQTRPQYRELLKELAAEQNWDAWLNYNLNMFDEQLFYSDRNLELLRKR